MRLRRWHLVWRLGLLVFTVSLSGCTWLVRASVSTNGDEGNNSSFQPVLSGDGRFVAFGSAATNLVPNDTNGAPDIFVRDLHDKTTERVSVTSSGVEGNAGSEEPSMSSDGRVVAFRSWATNLVADDTNGVPDVFLHDRQTGTTERITAAGGDQPRISGSGRYVVYVAPNFSVKLYDRQAGTTDTYTAGAALISVPSISDDGRYIAYLANLGGTQPNYVAYVVDRETNTSTMLAPHLDGAAGPVLSGDGHVVVVQAIEPLSPDTFVERLTAIELTTANTEYVSVASNGTPASGGAWYGTAVSSDGRFVAFTTTDALTPQDTNTSNDVYVRDLMSNRTILAAKTTQGTAPGDVFSVALSPDGRYVAFTSGSPEIVKHNDNGWQDVFVHAFPEPNPTAVTPATVARGTNTTVTITGTYFEPDASLSISGSGIQVIAATRVDENTMTADVQVAEDAVRAAATSPSPTPERVQARPPTRPERALAA